MENEELNIMKIILTTQQQIDVLEKTKCAILSIKNAKKIKILCWFIREEIISMFPESPDLGSILHSSLPSYIPLFTRENAFLYTDNTTDPLISTYWWPIEDINSRVKFLDWMIKELKVTSLYGPDYL